MRLKFLTTHRWVSVPLAAAKLANGSMGGMFCDGAVIANFTSPKFSAARTDAWSKAHWVAIQKLHDELHALPNADMVLIGNTITDNLRNPTNNGVQLLQSGALDGACAEHFGAFEWLDPQGMCGLPQSSRQSNRQQTLSTHNSTMGDGLCYKVTQHHENH